MGYQWPASYLTADHMAMLHEIRMDANKPINHLLHEAVEMFYELRAVQKRGIGHHPICDNIARSA